MEQKFDTIFKVVDRKAAAFSTPGHLKNIVIIKHFFKSTTDVTMLKVPGAYILTMFSFLPKSEQLLV